MSDTVGFIGLGTMGMPMATNLAKAGVPLVVYDASPTATTDARRLGGGTVAGSAERGPTPTTDARRLAGVTVAESPAQVAAQSDVLFSCLPNNDIVLAVYLEAGGVILGGHTGVATSHCSPGGPE